MVQVARSRPRPSEPNRTGPLKVPRAVVRGEREADNACAVVRLLLTCEVIQPEVWEETKVPPQLKTEGARRVYDPM